MVVLGFCHPWQERVNEHQMLPVMRQIVPDTLGFAFERSQQFIVQNINNNTIPNILSRTPNPYFNLTLERVVYNLRKLIKIRHRNL